MRAVGLKRARVLREGQFGRPRYLPRVLEVPRNGRAHLSLDHLLKAFLRLDVRLLGIELEPLRDGSDAELADALSRPSYNDLLEERNRFNHVLQVFAHLGLLYFRVAVHHLIDILLDHVDCCDENTIAAGGDLREVATRL